MRRGQPSRKKQRENERRFEARRHDSARVLEGTEDPRETSDPVVAEVAPGGHDGRVRERRLSAGSRRSSKEEA